MVQCPQCGHHNLPSFPACSKCGTALRWYDNAYGSIMWALLVLHTTHVLTDWVDTVVLTGLMYTKHGMTGRRFVDVSENAMYWRFVWLAWLPIYLLIYWVPRWA